MGIRPGAQAAEPDLEPLEDGLAEKNEDPGVQDGIEGVEAESEEVPHLTAVWGDGLGEAPDCERQGAHSHDARHEGQQDQVVHLILSGAGAGGQRALMAPLLAVHVAEASPAHR